MSNRKICVLITKPDLDGQSRGAKTVAWVLREVFGEYKEPKIL